MNKTWYEECPLFANLVINLHHDDYNPDIAYLLGQGVQPVITVFLGRVEKACVAAHPMANRVNDDIRDLHRVTGLGSKSPFTVSHMLAEEHLITDACIEMFKGQHS